MVCLTCASLTKPLVLASLNPHNSPKTNRKPPVRRISIATPPPRTNQQQPSVAEIERAIGAGIFRDRDPRDSEQNMTLFDKILSNSIGKSEGSVEKKLRESGEWIINRTERSSRSYGKKILTAMFLWILPMWILLFLVASGVISLPFSSPFIDDLIM